MIKLHPKIETTLRNLERWNVKIPEVSMSGRAYTKCTKQEGAMGRAPSQEQENLAAKIVDLTDHGRHVARKQALLKAIAENPNITRGADGDAAGLESRERAEAEGCKLARHARFVEHDAMVKAILRRAYEAAEKEFLAMFARYADEQRACPARDPAMPRWNESTVDRLRSSVFQILAQGGYIENTRLLALQRTIISEPVLHYRRDWGPVVDRVEGLEIVPDWRHRGRCVPDLVWPSGRPAGQKGVGGRISGQESAKGSDHRTALWKVGCRRL